jgi:hypothetical protein
MKIYIEDPLANDLVINGVYCRKLGVLKNGEEKTFQIGDNAAKVFVIADKLSKGFCNEFYPLPEGTEDVFLSGANKYNPINGNAFRFDGVANEEVKKNRKSGLWIGIGVLCVAMIVGIIIGLVGSIGSFLNLSTKPKTFSDEGMSITLTEAFIVADYEGYTTCYDSTNVAVFVIKEEFSLMEGFEDYTLAQYGELVTGNNGLDASALKKSNNLLYFTYDYKVPDLDQTYEYYAFMYKGKDAFWLVQFATLEENVEYYLDDIFAWADSVEFAE